MFFRGTNFLTENAPKFSWISSAFIFCGVRQKSRKIPAKFPFPKFLKKIHRQAFAGAPGEVLVAFEPLLAADFLFLHLPCSSKGSPLKLQEGRTLGDPETTPPPPRKKTGSNRAFSEGTARQIAIPWAWRHQEVSEYGFGYGSKRWKSQFSVDSQLRTNEESNRLDALLNFKGLDLCPSTVQRGSGGLPVVLHRALSGTPVHVSRYLTHTVLQGPKDLAVLKTLRESELLDSVKRHLRGRHLSVLNLKFDFISDGVRTREEQIALSLKRHLFPHGGREPKAFWICFSRVHPPSEIKSNFKFKTLKRHLLKRHLTLSEITML